MQSHTPHNGKCSSVSKYKHKLADEIDCKNEVAKTELKHQKFSSEMVTNHLILVKLYDQKGKIKFFNREIFNKACLLHTTHRYDNKEIYNKYDFTLIHIDIFKILLEETLIFAENKFYESNLKY